MATKPEQRARLSIDQQLASAGWSVQDRNAVSLMAAQGVAVREFPLRSGFGFADYLLYVDAMAVGVVEAKKEGTTLTGVEPQTDRYSQGLPEKLPAPRRPLPFCYQTTGVETRFTNLLEPEARSRNVFAFHRPEAFSAWMVREQKSPGSTVRGRLRTMPPVSRQGLWPAQLKAVQNLEQSLAQDRPRALIQMATGSGKTFTACNFIYRLVKHAGARRVLFLVDRRTLGRQTLKEFQQFTTPDDGRSFTELYNVQLLDSNGIDPVSRVCITTIQRLYLALLGEPEYDAEDEEKPLANVSSAFTRLPPVSYNPSIPIETFDFIVTDECHRSIYNLWRQVLEYFDAHLIGLTATPSKQTLGFFHQNLVMEYGHDKAVADGVNVGFDIYRIRTEITSQGSRVEAGFHVDRRERQTRAVRAEQLDQDLVYLSNQLDRDVVAEDQIRTVIRTFRDRLPLEIFPGRAEVPKTLVFAKDDSHADDIVKIVREEFGKGNEFCQKITYRTHLSGQKPEEVLASFRNSYHPRIAVTVDMIATGTDIRPLECLLFLRDVRSLNYFEQMKGRGVRVATATDMQAATPNAGPKTHFIVVDAVGVCEHPQVESRPLERKRSVPLDRLLEAVAFGSTDPDVLSSLASRLARLDRVLTQQARAEVEHAAPGQPVSQIVAGLLRALDPDAQQDMARSETGGQQPTAVQVAAAAERLRKEAARPLLSNPQLRATLVAVQRASEQVIDVVSQDRVLEAGFSADAKDKARATVTSFAQFLRDHRDEITALQVLYSRPFRQRLTYAQVKELADAIRKPHPAWTPEGLWRAYETLDRSKVRGSGPRVLTDLVALVRHALDGDGELRPFAETVRDRYAGWLADQEASGRRFTGEQREWLAVIADHIATSLEMHTEDFELVPFSGKGGLGKAHQVFGAQLEPLLRELAEVLVQ